MEIYLQLFISFFKIGLFAFGGGYAVLSLIEHEVVTQGWITTQELTDIIAISQITPGPIGINSATYVGYVVTDSVGGAAVATFAMVLPSFIIMLMLCKFYFFLRGNKYLEFLLTGIRPAVIGLIAAAALLLMNSDNFIDYKSFIIFFAVFLASLKFKTHPIILVSLAAFAGYLFC